MNLNNFTIKAQESVQQAFNIAASKGQQAVECAHLLLGVISQAENIIEWLFGKLSVSSAKISRDIERIIGQLSQGIRRRIIPVIRCC